jgi:hypothetical protein
MSGTAEQMIGYSGSYYDDEQPLEAHTPSWVEIGKYFLLHLIGVSILIGGLVFFIGWMRGVV